MKDVIAEGVSAGVAYKGTKAGYETAKLIPAGEEGFITDSSLVIITDENRTYVTSGTGSEQTISLVARVMTAGDGITITNDDAIKADTVIFTGTRAQWEALSTAQKAKFNIVNITDEELTDDVITDTVEVGNMKAVTSNAVAEAIGKVTRVDDSFNITTGNASNYSSYHTIPKGTYIIISHFDHGSYNIDISYALEGSALFAPSRVSVTNNGLNGGMTQVCAVLKSDGTKQIRGVVYPYGTVTTSTCLFYFALVKIAD